MSSFMKAYKNIIAAILIFLSTALILRLANESVGVFILLIILMGIFIFHLIARNRIFFKSYFLSKWNLLTTKFSSDIKLEIPKELVFEKLLEVLATSTFSLKHADKKAFVIFATSPTSWLSWGENIYIELKELQGQTHIHFDSVAFQMHAWGKNEKNFDSFFQKLDDSLTV